MCPPRETIIAPPLGIMPRWLWDEQNPNPTPLQLWNRWSELTGAFARNAAAGLAAWSEVMRRCTFTRLHARAFVAGVKDHAEHAIYCDPPFPDAGDGYKYGFDKDDQRTLAKQLAMLKKCRVVVRFYDHKLIRELYPEPLWTWHRFEGRKQTNEAAAEEVLLTRNEPKESDRG